MPEHANAAQLRRLYEAFSAGDMETIASAVTDDFVLHALGRNPLAGDYKGRDGLMEFFGKNLELAGPTLKVEVGEILADDEFGVSFERLSASRAGRTLDVDDYTVWRFSNGKIAEMTLLSADPYAHDDFWS